jgi:hypothetical protein
VFELLRSRANQKPCDRQNKAYGDKIPIIGVHVLLLLNATDLRCRAMAAGSAIYYGSTSKVIGTDMFVSTRTPLRIPGRNFHFMTHLTADSIKAEFEARIA